MRIISALWLTLTLVVYCYLIPAWLASTIFSNFNPNPDMAESSKTIAYAAAACLYPIVLVFMEYKAWTTFALHRYLSAMIYATIPSILIIIIWGYLYAFSYRFWWPWE